MKSADESRPRRDAVEVGPVDGCGPNADEHLVVGGGRAVDIAKLDDVRPP